MRGGWRDGKGMKAYLDILKLVWPLALGMVNNAAMQFVDRAYLARESMASLEAVLPATSLVWLFLGFFQSIVGYSGVFVAQHHGAGNERMCARSYHAGLIIAALSGLAMLPLVPLGDMLFGFTPVSAEVAALERSYYDVAASCGVFVFGHMASSAYFTGIGRTRVVFWVNLAGNVLNILLDPIFIFGPSVLREPLGFFGVAIGPERGGMGIAGAAWATVISQAAQFAVLAALAWRQTRRVCDVRPSAGDEAALPTWGLCRRILRFGLASGGYEMLNMLSFAIFVFISGNVGDVALAASNACFTVNWLLFAPMVGFAIGAQTLVGQARGRGDDAGAVLATRRTLVLGVGFAALMAGIVVALHTPILSLFAPAEGPERAEFMSTGFTLMTLMFSWLLLDSADMILSGALKGAGDTRFVFCWMLVCSFLVWMPLVFVVSRLHNTMPALWSTMVAYVVVICAGSAVRWRRGRWKRHRLV